MTVYLYLDLSMKEFLNLFILSVDISYVFSFGFGLMVIGLYLRFDKSNFLFILFSFV